jgi:hypothetical protein
MALKNTLWNILFIVVGLGSFTYITIDNLYKINKFESETEKASTLLKSRKGTLTIPQTAENKEPFSEFYSQIKKAAGQTPLTKDPFAEVTELPDLQLTGIIYNDNIPYAVINEQVVAAGQIIDQFTVLKVGDNSVKLSDGEFSIDLELYMPMTESTPPPEKELGGITQ